MTRRSPRRWPLGLLVKARRPKTHRLRLENLEERTVPATIVWAGAASGDFNDGTKWIGGVAPGSGDDAQINTASAVVSVSSNTTVNSLVAIGDLSVTAGTFTANNGGSFSNDIIVAAGAKFDLAGGSLGWTAGAISGAGTFEVSNGATLALSGPIAKVMNTATMNNLGTINLSNDGLLQLNNDARLNNSGSFNFLSDADITYAFGTVPIFTNTGLVTKTGGTGLESDIQPLFNNEGGTITVNDGRLSLDGGTSTGGVYNVTNPSAILDLTGGDTQNYTGTYTGSGPGTVLLDSGVINVTLTDATFNFAPGLFEWTGGTITGLVGSDLTNAGELTLTGLGNKDLTSVSLNNSGTINLVDSGSWRAAATTITNSGTIDFQGNAGLVWAFGGQPGLTNTGTVKKTAGIGISTLSVPMTNSAAGTVSSQSGTLSVSGVGASNGTFSATAGNVVDITGSYTFNSGTSGTGAGQVRFSGSILTVAGAATMENFAWTGGTITGTGGLTVTDSLDMSGPGAKDLNAGNLTNQGSATLDGIGPVRIVNGSTFQNDGSFTFESDAWVQWNFGSGGNAFNNTGTVTKTSSTVTGTSGFDGLDFNNTGTVNVASGILFIDKGTESGNFVVAPAATLWFSQNTIDLNSGTAFSGSGKVLVSAGIVNFNTDVNIPSLTLSGGTLDGAGAATVGTTMGWTAGMVAGTVAIAPGATLAVSGGSAKVIDGGTVINNGTATVTGAGEIQMANGATFQNNGSFTFQSDASLRYAYGSGGNAFNNAGTLIKTSTAPAGTSGFNNMTLNNAGTVNVSKGVLYAAFGTHTGLFNVAAGATFNFAQGDHVLNPGAAFAGEGTVQVGANGDLIVNTPVTVNRLLSDSGGSAIYGTSTLTVANTFTWLAGGVYSGNPAFTLAIAPGATLAISGGSVKLIDGGTVVNNGTATVTGAGEIQMANGATFQNNGSFAFQSDADFRYAYGTSGNAFNNAGTLTKTSSTPAGTSGFDNMTLNNAGTVNVSKGVLYAAFGTHTGLFNVAAGATFNFAQGGHVLNPGAAFAGEGTVQVGANGDLIVNTPVTVNHLLSDSGGSAIYGNSTLTVADTFTWLAGGVYSGNPTFTLEIAPEATLTLGGTAAKVLDTATLRNLGRIVFDGVGEWQFANAATLRNLGTFDIQTDADLRYAYGGGGNRVVNTGLLTKSADAGNAFFNSVGLDNTGRVEVSVGALQFSGPVTQLSGTTLTAGTWQVNAGASLVLPANVTTNNANVVLNGGGATLPQMNPLATNNGTFRIAGGQDFTTTGPLANNGTVVVGPESTLTVNGAFTQSGTGKYISEIADQPASGDFGVLAVTGTATLNGTVQVDLVNGFGPTAGGNFEIMTFASQSGNFTFESPSTPFQGDMFAPVVNPTTLVAQSIVNAADLAVNAIFVPPSANPGANVQIGFEVKNLSTTATVVTDWIDSVYLSLDNLLDASDILVQRVTHSGTLEAGATYTAQTNTPLPGINPNLYKVIVVTDSRQFVPDTNRPNNKVVSGATLNVTVPAVTIGATTSGTISNGQDIYFRVDLPAGKTIKIGATFEVASELEMYVSYQGLPSRSSFDQSTFPVGQLSGQIILPGTQAGPFYILLHGREGATGGKDFDLLVEELTFSITSLDNAKGSNLGSTTVTINGAGFTPTTTARLQGGVVDLPATQVYFVDTTKLYATFNLNGVPADQYDVTVFNGATPASAADGFTVTTGAAGRLVTRVSAPAITRALTATTVTVDYENTGETDIVAPVMRLTANAVTMRLPEQEDFIGGSVQFIGINPNGPAGILPAGFKGSITFPAKSITAANVRINYQLKIVNNLSATIDWAGQKAAMRPAHIPIDAWDAVFANFVSQVGTTAGSYQQALANDATYLSEIGVITYDVASLVRFQMQKANALLAGRTLTENEDAGMPVPGALALSFERTNAATIAGRYQVGRLGRGWSDNWNVFATTDASGNATIQQGSAQRYFKRKSDGTYEANAGHFATLTMAGGAFLLKEPNGTLVAFRADGKLDFYQDTNGNRITTGYNVGGQLTSLTHSSGPALTIAYNGQGRISSVIDSAGRVSSYVYDPSGELLIEYTDKFGTTTYTYANGQGAARQFALLEIANSDNTHLFFNYDAQGRLIDQYDDLVAGIPQARSSFSYGSGGRFTMTNAEGAQTTFLPDHHGQMRRIIDPLGRTTELVFNENRQLVKTIRADGTTYSHEFDDRGNAIRNIDASGKTAAMTYSISNRLLSSTDARGNTVSYQYDNNDNLTRITYPDGTFEQFGHDSKGNVVTWTNARGQTLQNSYNALGLVTTRTLADSTVVNFNYDARGRLLTATNSSGSYTFTYNALDEIETFADPFGRTLDFTYDSLGRRTQSIDQSGFTVNSIYDAAGRLSQLRDGGNNLIVSYTYDDVGRLIRKDMNNDLAGTTGDTATTYEFDLAGQVTSVVNLGAGGAINSRYDYTLDTLGRPLTVSMQDLDAGTTDGATNYTYDAIGQLSEVELPDGRTIDYAYDAAGNRLSVADSLLGLTNYTVNSRNQITQAGTATYFYDLDGNLTSIVDGANTTTYAWSQESLLLGQTGPNGSSNSYEYDPFNTRVAAVRDGIRTEYLIDPRRLGDVVGEYTLANSVSYVHGIGLTSRVSGGDAAYFDFDGLTNTAGITDASGSYINRYVYLPFGEATTVAAGVENPFTFVGEAGVMSEGAGQFLMRARSYSASTGQFLSDDPIGLAGGNLNLRQYVHNSPTNAVDPSGLNDEYWGPGENQTGTGHGNTNQNNPANQPTNTNQTGGRPSSHQGKSGKPLEGTSDRGAASNAGKGAKAALGKLEGAGAKAAGGGFKALLGKLGGLFKLGGKFAGPAGFVMFNTPLGDLWLRDVDDMMNGRPDQFSPEGQANGDGGGAGSNNAGSGDPNELVGPSGFGPQGFMQEGLTLPYTIRFENMPNATLPAQTIILTQTIDDPDFDLDTFQLTAFNFGSYTVQIPAGLETYTTRVDAVAEFGLYVDVTATFDRNTKILTVTYLSIDPITLDVTADPAAGFLPPNNATHVGEGFVSYTIRTKTGLPTGTQVDGKFARIVFDANDPIDTNATLNTIDVGIPNATVTELPEISTTLTFPVSWTGTDDLNGSGVGKFDVYVSDNNGPWTLWQDGTSDLTANYTGLEYRSYRFYAVGTDNVGNQEFGVAAAEATIIATAGAYAKGDVYGADAGKKLTISPKLGLLANDPKLAGRTYTVQVVTQPANGTLTMRPDGGFTYVPLGTFSGLDSFTYQTLDSTSQLGNIATVTLATQLVNFKTVKSKVSEGKATLTIYVELRKKQTVDTTVNYTLSGITATAGTDFTATGGTVTFLASETKKVKTIVIPILADTTDENDETFRVSLSSPTNATIGQKSSTIVTIKDNDAPPTVGFSVVSSSFNEAAGTVTVAVSLSALSEKSVSVQFALKSGTATSGTDYTFTPGTLTFAPGETIKFITLSLTNDVADESDETILFKLLKPKNAKLGTSSHTLTLADNDP